MSIRTIYKTVTELVPNSGCTDDFTDFANVQLIADTACRNGLVFGPGATRKQSVFERSPACQSYSIIQRPQGGALRRRDVSGLSDIIHEKFESYSDNFRHNIDQNINNNANIDEEDTQETSAGNGGFGGFGGFKKSKRSPQWGGYGGYGGFGGGGFDGGAFDDNNNQNINQNVNANQNLMANLGRFNSFFGEGHHDHHHRGGSDGVHSAAGGLNGLGFGINENTDFNVNNNVAFEDTGFFKNKRSLGKRSFGYGDDEAFSDNNNQNINQNINNNQNLNEGLFRGVFSGGDEGGFDGDGFGGFGIIPYFIGGFDGGYGGYDGGAAMNDNINVNEDENNRHHGFGRFGGGGGDFGGGFKAKRNLCGAGAAGYGGRSNCGELLTGSSNININTVSTQPAQMYYLDANYCRTTMPISLPPLYTSRPSPTSRPLLRRSRTSNPSLLWKLSTSLPSHTSLTSMSRRFPSCKRSMSLYKWSSRLPVPSMSLHRWSSKSPALLPSIPSSPSSLRSGPRSLRRNSTSAQYMSQLPRFTSRLSPSSSSPWLLWWILLSNHR